MSADIHISPGRVGVGVLKRNPLRRPCSHRSHPPGSAW